MPFHLLSQAFVEDVENWIGSLICCAMCLHEYLYQQKGEGDMSTWEQCRGEVRLLFVMGVEIGLVFEREKHCEQNKSRVLCHRFNL